MKSSRWMSIAWPAFLAACVLEMLVFALVDPHDLRWLGQPLEWPRQAIYTLAFLAFWVVAIGLGALTALLSALPFEVNRSST